MADDDEKKDLTITFHPEFMNDMERISRDDPEATKALREMLANLHQAIEGVNSGKYATFEDGVEAITGQRPEAIYDDEDDEDEDIE